MYVHPIRQGLGQVDGNGVRKAVEPTRRVDEMDRTCAGRQAIDARTADTARDVEEPFLRCGLSGLSVLSSLDRKSVV